jgi:hypothetical protein
MPDYYYYYYESYGKHKSIMCAECSALMVDLAVHVAITDH